jgi:hypothetical protein
MFAIVFSYHPLPSPHLFYSQKDLQFNGDMIALVSTRAMQIEQSLVTIHGPVLSWVLLFPAFDTLPQDMLLASTNAHLFRPAQLSPDNPSTKHDRSLPIHASRKPLGRKILSGQGIASAFTLRHHNDEFCLHLEVKTIKGGRLARLLRSVFQDKTGSRSTSHIPRNSSKSSRVSAIYPPILPRTAEHSHRLYHRIRRIQILFSAVSARLLSPWILRSCFTLDAQEGNRENGIIPFLAIGAVSFFLAGFVRHSMVYVCV